MKIKEIEGVGLALNLNELIATLLDHAHRNGKRILILTSDAKTGEPESIACLPLSNERTAVLLANHLVTLDKTENEYLLAKLPGEEHIVETPDPEDLLN